MPLTKFVPSGPDVFFDTFPHSQFGNRMRDSINTTAESRDRPRQVAEEVSDSFSLDQLVSFDSPAADLRHRVSGVVVGTLVGCDGAGLPLVEFPGNPLAAPVPARTTVAIDEHAFGRQAVILCEREDPARPIVIGLLHKTETNAEAPLPAIRAELDDERLVLTAEREIVLRCGKASITLTRAGKVLIRGAYLLSRSSGVNRIKGGSVQIN